MALIRITPIAARVRWDRTAGRPSEIHWANHHLRVVDLDSVRDERAAYPAGQGPRLHLTLRTADGGRAAIVFDGARRRWYLEALEGAA